MLHCGGIVARSWNCPSPRYSELREGKSRLSWKNAASPAPRYSTTTGSWSRQAVPNRPIVSTFVSLGSQLWRAREVQTSLGPAAYHIMVRRLFDPPPWHFSFSAASRIYFNKLFVRFHLPSSLFCLRYLVHSSCFVFCSQWRHEKGWGNAAAVSLPQQVGDYQNDFLPPLLVLFVPVKSSSEF